MIAIGNAIRDQQCQSISGPIGGYWAPQLTNNWKGGGLIWVAWGRMGPHGAAWG
jgi:hypothetical protein